MDQDNLSEYIRAGEPHQRQRAENWRVAIGLQKVDGLETSKYLVDAARRNIEGEISLAEVKELLEGYYKARPARSNHTLRNREMLVGGSLADEGKTITSEDNPASNPASKAPALNEQVSRLLSVLNGEMSRRTLMTRLALKDRNSFVSNYLEPALRIGYIEPTQPSSPRSPTQKYRLTEKGREVIASLGRGANQREFLGGQP